MTGKLIERIKCVSCDGSGRYDGVCGWCKGNGKRPRRMDGYYIGFNTTGSFEVDKVLGAVACAGKACHHTDGWGDDTLDYDDHTGGSPEMWIQNAAIEAASRIITDAKVIEAAEELARRVVLQEEGAPMRVGYIKETLKAYRKAVSER